MKCTNKAITPLGIKDARIDKKKEAVRLSAVSSTIIAGNTPISAPSPKAITHSTIIKNICNIGTINIKIASASHSLAVT